MTTIIVLVGSIILIKHIYNHHYNKPVLRSITIITSPRVRRPGTSRVGRGALDIIIIAIIQ